MNETLKALFENVHVQMISIVLVSLILAFLVRFVMERIVLRIFRKTATDLDDLLVHLFRTPITISIVFGGVYLGMQQAYPDMGLHWFKLFRGILLTGVILAWTTAFLSYGSLLVDRLSREQSRFQMIQPRTRPMFSIALKGAVLIGAIYFILLAWNKDVSGWLASAGVAGIAIGFAAKDSLANLISGLFIIADQPYKIGDFIVMDDGERGRVTDIGLRSTRLMTLDDVELVIPNAVIGNERITNQSGGPKEAFRLRVPIGVAYGSDVDKVRSILAKVAREEPKALQDPSPVIRFKAFGNSSLDFDLMVWVEKPEFSEGTVDRLLDASYKAFALNDIEIPFPKRDLYIRQIPEALTAKHSKENE